MKNWSKIVLGTLAVLLCICILGGVFLWYSGVGDSIRFFANGISQMKKGSETLAGLNERFPFKEPGNGLISEERLRVYIAVCSNIKPRIESYSEWVKANKGQHEGRKEGLGVAKRAITLTAKTIGVLVSGLKTNSMSPKEFLWLRKKVYEAEGSPGKKETSTAVKTLKALEKAASFPELSAPHRRALRTQIAGFKAAFKVRRQRSAFKNTVLVERYAEQLKACDPGETGWRLIKRFLRGGRHDFVVGVKTGGDKNG